MRSLKYLSIIILIISITLSCSKGNYQKGKKGDFLFRKCTSCEKIKF